MRSGSSASGTNSALEHLAQFLYLGAWKESSVAMLTAYFDASGSQDGTEALVVAGFVSTTEKWIAFEKEWKALLSAFGVTSLHMKDFCHSRREYEGWDKNQAKRRLFMSQLIYVIEEHHKCSFGSSIFRSAFLSANDDFFLKEWVSQYGYAACSCISKVKSWAQEKGEDFDKIMFVFEDGDVGKGKMLDMANRAFGFTPSLWKKDRSVVFQAADLLAYEQYRVCLKVLGKRDNDSIEWRELRENMRFMWNLRGADKWGYTTEENFRQGCENASIPMRESRLVDDSEKNV